MTIKQLNIFRETPEQAESKTEIMQFINSVPDEFMRKMIFARYVSGLTWRKIALTFSPNSEDNCRMTVKRYLHSLGID